MSLSRNANDAALCTSDPGLTTEIIDQRSAVIHVDLTGGDSKRSVQAKLRGITSSAEGLNGRCAALEHIVIVLHGCPMPQSQLLRIARRLSLSLHQHLEMARGTYVAITTLLNSPALAPDVLRDRILTLTRCASGIDPAVAVCAQDITGKNISEVAVTEML